MTEEDLKQFLETNKAEIQSAVKARMIESLLSQNRWEISGAVAKTVEEFVAAEIVPEVKKYLADQKGPILEAALKGAAEIGNTIAQQLTARTAKVLAADSYQFRNVMKALFDAA